MEKINSWTVENENYISLLIHDKPRQNGIRKTGR